MQGLSQKSYLQYFVLGICLPSTQVMLRTDPNTDSYLVTRLLAGQWYVYRAGPYHHEFFNVNNTVGTT